MPSLPTPPVSEPMPSSIPPELPKAFPKWIIIGIILLFLAAISIFAYKLILRNKVTPLPEPTPTASTQPTPTPQTTNINPSPTPDPTADWKIYTNRQYGIEFKYPPYLIKKDILWPSQSIGRPKLDFDLKGGPYELYLFQIYSIEKSESSLSLNDWVVKHQSGVGRYVYGDPPHSSLRGSYQTAELKLTPDDIYAVFFTNKRFAFLFLGYNLEKDRSPNAQDRQVIFDQILSTFQFSN